jgi:hypothetical protein
MSRSFFIAMAALGAALIGEIGPAHAVTIKFDSFTFNDDHAHLLTDFQHKSFSLDGFTITTLGGTLGDLGVLGTQTSQFLALGTVAAFNTVTQGVPTLTAADGRTFAFESIDVANLNAAGLVGLVFIGKIHGGGTVTQSFSFDSFGALEKLSLPTDFRNLDSLSISEPNSGVPYQFTNLVVEESAIPEPAGLGFIGLGAGLVAFRFARRR